MTVRGWSGLGDLHGRVWMGGVCFESGFTGLDSRLRGNDGPGLVVLSCYHPHL